MMADYRLYFMTRDGHIHSAAAFTSNSDEEALLYAEDHRDERALELWCGARVVAKLEERQDA